MLLLKRASRMIILRELISCLKKPVCIIFILRFIAKKFCISSCGLYIGDKGMDTCYSGAYMSQTRHFAAV